VRPTVARWGLFAATLSSVLTFLGCGGASSFNPPPPPPIALAVTTATLPKAVTGTAYTTKLQATGGTPPYTWSLALFPGQTAASVLPAGIALGSDGTVSGTAASGCYSTWFPQFAVRDAAGGTAGAGLELDCVAPLTFSSNLLPDGNVAIAYSALFYTQGGDPPIQYALTSGSLPPGVTLDKTQALQGTPSATGKYIFTIQASDSKTPTLTATQAFTLTIDNNLVLPNTSLPGAVQNVAYLEQIQPAGGTPPYHFALGQNSALPPGLSLNTTTGQVSGIPTAVTQNTMVITISDSAPQPASISPFVTLTVAPPLSFQTTTLPDGPRGIGYFGGNISLIGGRQPYTVQVSSGALPSGLTASANSVAGIPTTDGTFQFTLKVSDSYETPNTATQNFQIRVSDPISITGPGSAGILYNQSYSTSFPVTGGIPPYTWHMSAVPPAGFTFDTTTGILSGTPTGLGFFNPNVSVQDSSNPPQGATYFQFVLDIYGKLIITASSLPPISTGRDTSIGIFSTGGAAPLQWSISSGTVPPGMTFGTNNYWEIATISGAPTQAGSYAFTLALSDGNAGSLHQTASLPLTLMVKDPGQMTRNDALSTATPLSNIMILASISPYSDPSIAGPDIDVYSASAAPGSVVNVGVTSHSEFAKPQNPPYDSLLPVVEIVDGNGVRYQTCGGQVAPVVIPFNQPCINGLPGSSSGGPLFNTAAGQSFQVPGTGTAPVTFFIRVSDARGDARPDFIYTLNIFGVN
jgi:Putative Ig domain